VAFQADVINIALSEAAILAYQQGVRQALAEVAKASSSSSTTTSSSGFEAGGFWNCKGCTYWQRNATCARCRKSVAPWAKR
jgi:hypothetical protein